MAVLGETNIAHPYSTIKRPFCFFFEKKGQVLFFLHFFWKLGLGGRHAIFRLRCLPPPLFLFGGGPGWRRKGGEEGTLFSIPSGKRARGESVPRIKS